MLGNTLKELVDCSYIIVIATQEDPPWHKRDIPYDGESDKEVPAYGQTIFHFRVNKTLKGVLLAGSSIEVVEADTSMHQSEHFNYHAMNMTMCIDWQYYVPKYKVENGEPRILFLQKENNELVFMNHTGYEGVLAEDGVLELLKQSDKFIPGNLLDW